MPQVVRVASEVVGAGKEDLVMRKTKEEEIRKLEDRIVAVCMKCSHAMFSAGFWECKISRLHCHSDKVRQWLAEIEKLKGGGDDH